MCEDNPVDEYNGEKEKTAVKRRSADTAAWQSWVDAGGREGADVAQPLFQPLMSRFEPAFRKAMKKKPPGVSDSAYRIDLKEQAQKAFNTWNPQRQGGAALNTHVTNYIKKTMRYGGRRANVARIPEQPMAAIGHIDRASDQLQEEFGRTPSFQELHTHFDARTDLPKTVAHELRTPQHIQRIQEARWKDIPASTFESDPTANITPRMNEVIGSIAQNPAAYFKKTKEQQVFSAIYSDNVNRTQDIAKKLGISEQEVSKLKTRIIGKIEGYM